MGSQQLRCRSEGMLVRGGNHCCRLGRRTLDMKPLPPTDPGAVSRGYKKPGRDACLRLGGRSSSRGEDPRRRREDKMADVGKLGTEIRGGPEMPRFPHSARSPNSVLHLPQHSLLVHPVKSSHLSHPGTLPFRYSHSRLTSFTCTGLQLLPGPSALFERRFERPPLSSSSSKSALTVESINSL